MAMDLLVLVARILLAAMFLSSGYSALSDIEATTAYFAGLGLQPAALLAWLVGIFEFAGGVLLVFGFQTRAVSVALALFTLAASFLGHSGQGGGDPMTAFMHSQMLLKDIAVAGGLVLLALHGAGRISLDVLRRSV